MLKKLLVFVLALAGATLLANVNPTEAHAQGRYRHAYQPRTVWGGSQAGWMQARVNNVAGSGESTLLCVEAFGGNMKYHLGCLPVNWSDIQSGSVEFNAPTVWLPTGSYRVVYTYPDMYGRWHRIMSMNMQVMDGQYQAW